MHTLTVATGRRNPFVPHTTAGIMLRDAGLGTSAVEFDGPRERTIHVVASP